MMATEGRSKTAFVPLAGQPSAFFGALLLGPADELGLAMGPALAPSFGAGGGMGRQSRGRGDALGLRLRGSFALLRRVQGSPPRWPNLGPGHQRGHRLRYNQCRGALYFGLSLGPLGPVFCASRAEPMFRAR